MSRFTAAQLAMAAKGTGPAAIALRDLITTLEHLDRLQQLRRDFTDKEDALYGQLEDRRTARENELKRLVTEALGVDYDVLEAALA